MWTEIAARLESEFASKLESGGVHRITWHRHDAPHCVQTLRIGPVKLFGRLSVQILAPLFPEHSLDPLLALRANQFLGHASIILKGQQFALQVILDQASVTADLAFAAIRSTAREAVRLRLWAASSVDHSAFQHYAS